MLLDGFGRRCERLTAARVLHGRLNITFRGRHRIPAVTTGFRPIAVVTGQGGSLPAVQTGSDNSQRLSQEMSSPLTSVGGVTGFTSLEQQNGRYFYKDCERREIGNATIASRVE